MTPDMSTADSAPPDDQDDRTEPRLLVIGRKSSSLDRQYFGRILRAHRVALDLSAKEVAETVGVTASFVRSIETGQQAPSSETAAKLFNALKIDQSTDATFATVTDPATGESFDVAFAADRKGGTSPWTLERVLLPEGPNTVATADRVQSWTALLARSPDVQEQQRLRENRENHRYEISPEESMDTVRLRTVRRLARASDRQVRQIHAFLDELGIEDPADDWLYDPEDMG